MPRPQKAKQTPASRGFKAIGQLASLGPAQLAEVPFLLPSGYDAPVEPLHDARLLDGSGPQPIWLKLTGTPTISRSARVPRVVFPVVDPAGNACRASIFGHAKPWQLTLTQQPVGVFMATATTINGHLYVTVADFLPKHWVSRPMPRYPGADRKMSPYHMRELMLSRLQEAIPLAVERIAGHLCGLGDIPSILERIGGSGWSLEQALLQVHRPHSMRHAEHAHRLCRRLAHLAVLHAMYTAPSPGNAKPLPLRSLDRRMAATPWPLTEDQRSAVRDIACQLRAPSAARHLVLGDVGTGKTIVGQIVALAACDEGARCAVLLPNEPLARQWHRELLQAFPDASAELVTGKVSSKDPHEGNLLIGTTALLHRDLGPRPIDLHLVDEQHKYSVNQREQLMAPHTHLVEFSATPIPRSQALVKFGRVTISELRQCHQPKTLHTHYFEGPAGARTVFGAIRPVIDAGQPLLVVLPKREVSRSGDQDLLGDRLRDSKAPGEIDDRHSVELAYERWSAQFPGKVRSLTSDTPDKTAVLADIAEGTAQILICTTVVEVGVNLPNLRHMVIVCPERHGLTSLHQLRGRLARQGGEGHCYLLSPDPLTPQRADVLRRFAKTPDGFSIASLDLELRGAGDLRSRSDKQSGSDDTFLFGLPVDISCLDEILPIYDDLRT